MKQLSLFFFLFLAVEFTSAQQIVKLCDGGVQSGVFLQAPSRSVENVNDGVLVTYTFDKATIMEDPLFEGRLMWKVVGFGVNDIPTQPAIPYRIDSYCVPVGHLAVVELVDSQFIDLPYSLSPARPPLSDSGGECYTLSNVPSISSYVGYFPTSVVGPCCV